MILSLVTPASPVVTTEEAKTQLRVTNSVEDTYIDTLVGAATNVIENFTENQIGSATWLLRLDSFRCINLPKHPVSSITSITYFDSDNNGQTLDVGLYNLYQDNYKSILEFDDDTPDLYDRTDAVSITFVSGYATIPPAIKQGILMVVTDLYDNRGETVKRLPTSAERLVYPYKRMYQ